MIDLESSRDGIDSSGKAAGESLRLARGIIRWTAAVANVVGAYALIVWHEPTHLCGFAALTIATFSFFEGAVAIVFRLHIALWRFLAEITALIAILGGVALLVRGAWTNKLVFLTLALLFIGGLMIVSFALSALVWILTYEPEPPAPVEDSFPKRFEVRIPTDDDAESEARRLIADEYRTREGSR